MDREFGRYCFKSNVFLKAVKAYEACSGNAFESVQCCIIRRQVLIQLVCNLEREGGLAIQAGL